MRINTIDLKTVFTSTFDVGISQKSIIFVQEIAKQSKMNLFQFKFMNIITMWKDICGFEDRCEISDSGGVRNKNTGRILVCKIDKDGYQQIGIRKVGDRKKYWFSVHKCVALHFIDNVNIESLQVDHIDNNKLNNNISNLRWVTVNQNNLNRELKNWSSNTTTKELYITKYRNGYMVRINRSDYKTQIWEKDLEIAIKRRDECLCEIKRIAEVV